MFHLSADCN